MNIIKILQAGLGGAIGGVIAVLFLYLIQVGLLKLKKKELKREPYD